MLIEQFLKTSWVWLAEAGEALFQRFTFRTPLAHRCYKGSTHEESWGSFSKPLVGLTTCWIHYCYANVNLIAWDSIARPLKQCFLSYYFPRPSLYHLILQYSLYSSKSYKILCRSSKDIWKYWVPGCLLHSTHNTH